MFKTKTFPEYHQLNQTDCGPTCLKIIAAYYGRFLDLAYLRNICHQKSQGTSFANLTEAGKKIGLGLTGVRVTIEQLKNEVSFPVILHWNQNHFVVLYAMSNRKVRISDPELGLIDYPYNDFYQKWSHSKYMLILLAEPIETKIQVQELYSPSKLSFLLKILKPYKTFYLRLFLALIILLIAQITLPFLTQSLVDYGINIQDLGFIYLVVTAQVFLIIVMFLSKILREQILLRISIGSTKTLLKKMIAKILKLPLQVIESKNIGDYVQRVRDQDRIQNFLNQTVFSLFFDFMSIILFVSILAYFDMTIFMIFILSAGILFSWSLLFLKKQAILDHQLFKINSNEQSQIIQLVNNAAEIKLNGSHERHKFNWQALQVLVFRTELEILKTDQLQYQVGSFIKDLAGILIILVSALGVVNGRISFGTMLAIQFIVGSLSLPISTLLNFITEFQKTSLSLDRILDLINETEDRSENEYLSEINCGSIKVCDLSFSYFPESPKILKKINFSIPKNKITALVGESGSGKSTLLKILLKLYHPTSGSIKISGHKLENIDSDAWQKKCAAVLQDGKLFNDTIERNITESKSNEIINHELLTSVITLCNLKDLIDGLPIGIQTIVGENASFLSGGEKQRLMIARAMYKEPSYLFLDEATSALDALNERTITDNILKSTHSCTIVVAAHRLSTIKLADNIVVLKNGEIVEQGNHEELLIQNGLYHNLLECQL